MPRFPYVKTEVTVKVLEQKVGESDTDPIEGAIVSVDGIPLAKKTDKNGKVEFKLDPGYYAICVKANQQEAMSPILTKPGGGKDELVFTLDPP